MPARLAPQEDENWMMEAACPQAASARLPTQTGHPASIRFALLKALKANERSAQVNVHQI
jgi:hypothetical protein